jgi:hypothetical protein
VGRESSTISVSIWSGKKRKKSPYVGRFDPWAGEYYRLIDSDRIVKVVMVNKSGDEVNISPIDDDMIYSVRRSVFGYGCERVWKTGAAAELLNRSPRSIKVLHEEGYPRNSGIDIFDPRWKAIEK